MGPRKEERSILQAAPDDHARTLVSSTSAPLLVFKEILNTVVNLMFWSGDPDCLDEVLHPLCTFYISAAKNLQDQSYLLTYNLLSSDGNNILEDIQLFQHRLYFPEELRIFCYFPVQPSGTTLPYATRTQKRKAKETSYLPDLHLIYIRISYLGLP